MRMEISLCVYVWRVSEARKAQWRVGVDLSDASSSAPV